MIKLLVHRKIYTKSLQKYEQLFFDSQASDLSCVAIGHVFWLSWPSNGRFDISDIKLIPGYSTKVFSDFRIITWF